MIYVVFYFFFLCFNIFSYEAEGIEKKRFFCVDFHGSASGDVINILEQLGHEVVLWSMSSYGAGYSKHLGLEEKTIKGIDFRKWLFSEEFWFDEFYQEHQNYLKQFDGFISAVSSSFALLYEKMDKPIIIVNAVRYEIPFTDKPKLWKKLNDFLISGVKRKKIFIVANNKADREYLKFYTGLDSVLISSLCSYTNSVYTGKINSFIFQPINRPYHFYDDLIEIAPELIEKDIPRPYEWQDIYDYKGIIHIPYQVSTMSVLEQYAANVPLFFLPRNFYLN